MFPQVDLSKMSNLELLEDKLNAEQALKTVEDAMKVAGITEPDQSLQATLDFLKLRVQLFAEEIARRVQSAR